MRVLVFFGRGSEFSFILQEGLRVFFHSLGGAPTSPMLRSYLPAPRATLTSVRNENLKIGAHLSNETSQRSVDSWLRILLRVARLVRSFLGIVVLVRAA